MKHDFLTSADIGPHDDWGQRNIIDGGLAICKVCGGAEGSLTTDCPGERIPYERDQEVYRGKIDYVADEGWVSRTSKSSPEFWKVSRNG